MSSSTSSSEQLPRGRGWRIALLVMAALALIEWGTRAEVTPGTADLARYREFPEKARKLVAAPAPRIVFIGDSVADRVQPEVFADEWRRLTGKNPSVEKFIAYYSNISTWSRIYAQYFWKQHLAADVVVITLHENTVFADAEALDVGNLALFFTGPEDRDSLFQNELTSLAHRADYLLSSASHAFAARDRIRVRVLNLIPGYRDFATETNELNFEFQKRQFDPDPAPSKTYHALESLLAHASAAGVKICFVAFPMRPGPNGRKSYIISPTAIDRVHDSGMFFLDLRDMDVLTADMYSDNVHLNGKGQPVYSRKLARELHRIWSP